jgi:hypothetical protein
VRPPLALYPNHLLHICNDAVNRHGQASAKYHISCSHQICHNRSGRISHRKM